MCCDVIDLLSLSSLNENRCKEKKKFTIFKSNLEEPKNIFLQQGICVHGSAFVNSKRLAMEKTFPTDDAFRSDIYGIFLLCYSSYINRECVYGMC